ncbi:MAG: hypothetical protein RR009_04485 [Oscillospiraceae bacterium]
MTKQKNKFLTFLFSLAPGCGQMFMGFMKRGISLLAVFICICAISSFINIYELMFVALLVWCYSFFDSLNLMSCTPDKFEQIEDDFLIIGSDLNLGKAKLFTGKFNRALGITLIVIGSYAIWSSIMHSLYNNFYGTYPVFAEIAYMLNSYLPRIAGSLIIIFIGISLIKHKKKETEENDIPVADDDEV